MLERAAFTFTHSQKQGIFLLVLILLVALCSLISFNYLTAQKPYTSALLEQNFTRPVTVQDSSFRVDINVADSSKWASLEGISPQLSKRIIRYRKAIGGFRTVDQVSKVYGLAPHTFQKIKPQLYYTRFTAPKSKKRKAIESTRTSKKTYPKLDINVAGVEEFEQLPGIGKTLAKRIVKYRNTLGGFSNIEELKRVYYLEPGTYRNIEPYLYLEVPSSIFAGETNEEQKELENYFTEATVPSFQTERGLTRGIERDNPAKTLISKTAEIDKTRKAPIINLNTADSASLALLPGLETRLVMRIIKYRRLLGFFHSVDQLKLVYGLSPQIYDQIKPYLKVEDLDKFPRKDLNITFARNLAFYPFIDKTVAEAIVKERKILGHFKSWEEVLAVPGITSDMLAKLQIYFEL